MTPIEAAQTGILILSDHWQWSLRMAIAGCSFVAALCLTPLLLALAEWRR